VWGPPGVGPGRFPRALLYPLLFARVSGAHPPRCLRPRLRFQQRSHAPEPGPGEEGQPGRGCEGESGRTQPLGVTAASRPGQSVGTLCQSLGGSQAPQTVSSHAEGILRDYAGSCKVLATYQRPSRQTEDGAAL
jgi:hypothetical protein